MMTNDAKGVTDTVSSAGKAVFQANGDPLKVTEMGTASVRVNANGREGVLKLNDTLVVPDLTTKLLSVPKLDTAKTATIFWNGRAYVVKGLTRIDHDGQIVATGTRRGDLFELDQHFD